MEELNNILSLMWEMVEELTKTDWFGMKVNGRDGGRWRKVKLL